MTSANRATRISKLHTLLKKSYKPTLSTEDRPLMEHLLYACLLENAPYELADESLARLEQDYFDWNEVRVTTVTELAEVLARLPDATSAAMRLKKNLHGLFESTYTFDLEELKKQNLGKAVQKFESLPAMTPFVLAYVTQHGLGGHAIPLDSAALRFFWLSDIINETELKTGRVTGLERAIPKAKGVEFASLLHQAAVALNIDPNDETARKIVLTLNPALEQKVAEHVAAVKKRRVAKAKAAADAAADEAEAASAAANKPKGGKSAKAAKAAPKTADKAAEKNAPAAKANDKNVAKKSTKKAAPAKSAAAKSAPEQTDSDDVAAKANDSKSASDAGKSSPRKKASAEGDAAGKKSVKKSKTASPKKKPAKSSASASGTESTGSKTASKKLSKRKPR
jgi:chemotaxis protein histidine kinase CheA